MGGPGSGRKKGSGDKYSRRRSEENTTNRIAAAERKFVIKKSKELFAAKRLGRRKGSGAYRTTKKLSSIQREQNRKM